MFVFLAQAAPKDLMVDNRLIKAHIEWNRENETAVYPIFSAALKTLVISIICM